MSGALQLFAWLLCFVLILSNFNYSRQLQETTTTKTDIRTHIIRTMYNKRKKRKCEVIRSNKKNDEDDDDDVGIGTGEMWWQQSEFYSFVCCYITFCFEFFSLLVSIDIFVFFAIFFLFLGNFCVFCCFFLFFG